jgi:hypothetical protein
MVCLPYRPGDCNGLLHRRPDFVFRAHGRTIYLNNIADSPEDIAPTLSMGLTMDHAVSMLIPLGGGLLWAKFGYSWVFVSAGCLP